MDVTFEAGSTWAYLLVFLAAATPVVEVLVVIPAGILAGLSPLLTTLFALAGNLSTVVLVGMAGERIVGRWRRRRPAREGEMSPRARRARAAVQRWGVPGLAMLAPLTTGTHIATMAALATGATRRRVLRWMAAGLGVWSAAVTLLTTAGLEVVR